MLTLTAVLLGTGPLVRADEPDTEPDLSEPSTFLEPHHVSELTQASYSERIAALEAELSSLQLVVGREDAPSCYDAGGSCGCDGGCDGGCGGHCRGSGFFGGFSFVFLKPRLDNNTAFTITDSTNFPNEFVTEQNFDYDYELSPRIWLGGVDDSGFGGRVRYWEFDHSADTQSAADPGAGDLEFLSPTTLTVTDGLLAGGVAGAGDSIVARSGLEAYTIDAELMQRLDFCHWLIDIGGGFRHASISHSYSATAIDAGGTIFATSDIGHRFDGVGPTIFAETRRALGSSGLSLFASGRASLLYGDRKYQAIDHQFGAFADSARTVDDTTLRIGEVQIGGIWSTDFSCGASAFAQVAWEAQIWDGAGNSSQPSGDDLGLMGFNVTFGVER